MSGKRLKVSSLAALLLDARYRDLAGRRLLDLPGAHPSSHPLRPPESMSLLERLIGADRVAAERAADDRLARRMLCQPLAVTDGRRPGFRPARLALIAELPPQLIDGTIPADGGSKPTASLVERRSRPPTSDDSRRGPGFRRDGRAGRILDIPVNAVAALPGHILAHGHVPC